MLHYILQRLLLALIVIIGVGSIVFLLIHLVPGDAVEVMLGESASFADRQALRQQLGLNDPLYLQWWHYLLRLSQFDLGVSLHSGRAVTDILMQRLPVTLLLAVTSLLVAMLIAIPTGVIAALHRNRFADRCSMVLAMIGAAIPNFWLGPLLVLVFAFQLGWFPVSGLGGLDSVVLPAITLGTALAAIQSRLLRTSLLEVLDEPYIHAARARGLPERSVVWRHALRNALLPTITIFGAQVGALLTGAVVTEQIFDWPGLGQLTIESIHKRDYPVLQACILIISGIYVFVNLLTDIAISWLDPRIRLDA